MDVLIYRGVERVRGAITSYTDVDDVWTVRVVLAKPVAAIFRARFGSDDVLDVTFYGATALELVVPTAARQRLRRVTLQEFLLQVPLEIYAPVTLRPLSQEPGTAERAPMAAGVGMLPEVAEGVEDAIQRAVRFLMMGDDPLDRSRGGGLGGLRHRPLLSEAVARRLVARACQRYNDYAGKQTSRGWVVYHTSPSRVRYVSYQDLEDDFGSLVLEDLLKSSPSGGLSPDARALSITFQHRLRQEGSEVSVGSALAL